MHELDKKTYPVQLLIRMTPPWVFIDEIRRFTESFCACACPGADREAQVGLAVHELMQNAVPHAVGEEIELLLGVSRDRGLVSIQVTNGCSDADYQDLRARIERMNQDPDPLAHYVKVMHDHPSHTRGGLGLARVRFEAQLDISVRHENGSVTVEACGPLRAPQLPQVGGGHG